MQRLDGLMPEGVQISNNTLAFTRPLEHNDSGVYRCEVINDVGLSSQTVNVWVHGKLQPELFHSLDKLSLIIKITKALKHSPWLPDVKLYSLYKQTTFLTEKSP